MAEKNFDPRHYKERQRASWSAAAKAYSSHMVEIFRPLTERMLSLLALQEGQKILDVASGPGEPALSVARALKGTGRVIGTDLAEGMVAEAQRRARSEGLQNVEFRMMDAEALEFPDGSFDRVTCRLGLMLFPHPQKALQEMQRVLVPGGKVVLAVWGEEEKVSLIRLVQGVTREHFPQANVPGMPIPSAFGAPGALERALTEAGFLEIHVERFMLTPSLKDSEELWEAFREGTPLKMLLAQASPEVREGARSFLLRAAEEFRSPQNGRIELASEALLGVGTK